MPFSLSKKLMLAFIGVTLVVLLATLSLARWSFEKGFLDYTNALEQQRLTKLASQLAVLYQNQGQDWSLINERLLTQLLEQPVRPKPPHDIKPHQGQDFRRPPPREDFRHPPHRGDLMPPPRGQEVPPTALLSAESQLIAGRIPRSESEGWFRIPVIFDGQTIGELISAPKRHFDSPQETEFSQQQWVTSLIIGLFSMSLAVLVSLLLIRLLLAPIQRMLKQVSLMSNGDYQARLDEQRQDELGQLMKDLDRLAQTLEQNQSSRQRWLADISHELRTPVTVLAGELSALLDGIRPLEMKQVISLSQEVERLRHLIDDLYQLSVSDVGGLRYSFHPLNVAECLKICLDQVQIECQEKNLKLGINLAEAVMVNGDTQRLLQLCSNVLRNALAYTDAPGQIEVSLIAVDSWAEINVIDSPPGVTLKECEKLFEPLYRQEASRSRRTAGAGLGLAICRNIVEAHQGHITATPSVLGGLAVKVSLPLYTEAK